MDLFNDVMETNIEIPLSTKIGLMTAIVIILVIVFLVMKDGFKQKYGESAKWYFIIFLINLVNILLIMYYYKQNTGKYVGPTGLHGDEGSKGNFGKFLKCSFCDKNIYLKKTRSHQLMVNLDEPHYGYQRDFNKLMGVDTSKKIDFDNVNIKTTEKSVTKISQKIMYKLMYIISVWASHYFSKGYPDELGKFYRSRTRKGYSIIGDIILGVHETKERNAFVASGTVPVSIKLPCDYLKVITIWNMYTIWKPVAPPGFVALGDIIEKKNVKPRNDLLFCVPKKCVTITNDLVMVSLGYIDYGWYIGKSFGKFHTIDESKFAKETLRPGKGMFSLWRTPLNTFITEYHQVGHYLNGESLFYNIVNGNSQYFNKNGKPSIEMMKKVRRKLKAAILPKFLVREIIREYRIEFSGATPKDKNLKKYISDISDKSISDKTNFYDLLNLIFPGGFNYIINVDDNVTIDSLRLLPIQSILLEIMRHLFSPRRVAYILKNECLAYTRFDKERLSLIQELRKVLNRNKHIIKRYKGGENTCNNWSLVNIYHLNFINKLNRALRYIPKWHDKIFKDMDFEEFTNSRLIFLLEELKKYNDFIDIKCSAEKDLELEELRGKLKSEIKRYHNLHNTYLSKPKNCANWRYANVHVKELDDNFINHFKVINKARYKLEHSQFEEFTPAMLNYAIQEYQKMNNNIHKKCEK